ncbi:MAG: nuclear transport factor 2 family protein [Pseudomonadota bacterium]
MSDPALDRYCTYLETLSPERLAHLQDYVSADVHFRDPFNDCKGVDTMRSILDHMYQTFGTVGFKVSARSRTGDTAFIAWRFDSAWRGRAIVFDGVSHLTFNRDEHVTAHIDYWDAASGFYEKLPVIGWPLAALRRRISVG